MVYDLESGVVIARLEARNPETTRTRANFVLNDERSTGNGVWAFDKPSDKSIYSTTVNAAPLASRPPIKYTYDTLYKDRHDIIDVTVTYP
jgi:hypothetical protein